MSYSAVFLLQPQALGWLLCSKRCSWRCSRPATWPTRCLTTFQMSNPCLADTRQQVSVVLIEASHCNSQQLIHRFNALFSAPGPQAADNLPGLSLSAAAAISLWLDGKAPAQVFLWLSPEWLFVMHHFCCVAPSLRFQRVTFLPWIARSDRLCYPSGPLSSEFLWEIPPLFSGPTMSIIKSLMVPRIYFFLICLK